MIGMDVCWGCGGVDDDGGDGDGCCSCPLELGGQTVSITSNNAVANGWHFRLNFAVPDLLRFSIIRLSTGATIDNDLVVVSAAIWNVLSVLLLLLLGLTAAHSV